MTVVNSLGSNSGLFTPVLALTKPTKQVKETARARAPETAAFHGTAPASFPAQEAAASLPAAAGCGVGRAEQWARGRGSVLGRGRRMDNGDEAVAAALERVSGRRGADGRRRAMLLFFLSFFFLFISF
uniref:Uncharacterized protein n=1 Tax=Arundo donax TaxID=35708 RepID=A0A0A9GL75_ARUDO